MEYKQGTHIIASLQANAETLLRSADALKLHVDRLVADFGLQKLGEVYHDFPGGGFTAVICLSESHISFHTWPEHGLVNMDIYLSNYLRDNDGTVQAVFESLQAFFQASVHQYQRIRR